ncbi:oligosaccharide flippase family protein [Microbacterium arborescens]
MALLGTYARIAGPVGFAGLSLVALLVAWLTNEWALVLSAAPLLLVPLVNVRSVRTTAFMQVAAQWRSLAVIQASAAGLSLLVSVPLLLAFDSLLGPALQLLITELLFALMVARRASRFGIKERAMLLPEGERLGPTFGHLSAQAALGWIQGQADRILLGAFAGSAALGSYSFALALGRNPGDAISVASANVSRATVVAQSDEDEARQVLDRFLVKALLASAVIVLGLAVGVQVLLPLFLDATSWGEAIRAAGPILLSTVATVYAWSLSPVLIQFGAGRLLTGVKLIGLLFAPLIALAATSSLELAAWLLLARETVMMLAAVAVRWRLAPRRALAVALVGLVLGSLVLESIDLVGMR